ncbi:hypothetical protein FBEOM_13600 [Fusarium beomiforme]|uniref:Subtilisin-like serine protease n=1 Tax=Fusarium beomiforme TaxID=44412 RepID=A0A9P5A632_9HYPO|nr:hypothetical protein FBEOM_13600 [Fusarium beomiforme]
MTAQNDDSPFSSLEIPFTAATQLRDTLTAQVENGVPQLKSIIPNETWLPDYPTVPLESSEIIACLAHELCTSRLNKMYPYLWLVATQSSSHISPLHEQILRGRDIIITENPEMHLVWVNNKVFLKPVPAFLFCYDFWHLYLSRSHSGAPSLDPSMADELRRAALGYLRTYRYLIQHESDFRIAKREHLIPADVEYPRFMTFVYGFGRVQDHDVSLRYSYGQLRLTRLNLWIKISLGQWIFHKVHWQYADIFSQFYAPILFLFGVLSVILSAMQVTTQARPDWVVFVGVSAWFSVISLLSVALLMALLGGFLAFMVFRELRFALCAKLGT